MLPKYQDILDAASKRPLWYTESGVPRFTPFRPQMLAVYDQLAVLTEIECADPYCRRSLYVGVGSPRQLPHRPQPWGPLAIEEFVRDGVFFGDPPRHGCLGYGETVSANEIKLIEVWEYQGEWARRRDLERRIDA